jgi:hypothetical protein
MEIDCLARRAGKDGDFAVFDLQLNAPLLSHEPSAQQLPGPATR